MFTLIGDIVRQFLHQTHRIYDGEQVLQITVPDFEYDANGDAVVRVHFDDRSRHIAGYVTIMLWKDCNDNQRDVGQAVMACYDAGAYNLS